MNSFSSDPAASRSLRDQGIAALRSGDKVSARQFLSQALNSDPTDEYSWLWLSGSVETDGERRYCLQQVLAINRQNEAAKQGLAQLPSVPPFPPASLSTAASPNPSPPSQPQPIDYPANMVPGAAGPSQAASAPMQPGFPGASNYPQESFSGAGGALQGGLPGAVPPSDPLAVGYSPSFHVPTVSAQRPTGISCLAILSIIFGVFLLGMAILFIVALLSPEVREGIEQAGLGLPPGFLAMMVGVIGAIIGLIALIGIVSGVGLWRGKKWAWWLSTISLAFGIVSSMLNVIVVATRPDLVAAATSTITERLVNVLVNGLIFLYFFKQSVWDFFQLRPGGKGTAALICLGVSFILSVAILSLAVL